MSAIGPRNLPRDYLVSLRMRVVGTLTTVAAGLTRLSFAALALLCLSLMTDRLRIGAPLGERVKNDEAQAHVT
jgi:hypothetical protein